MATMSRTARPPPPALCYSPTRPRLSRKLAVRARRKDADSATPTVPAADASAQAFDSAAPPEEEQQTAAGSPAAAAAALEAAAEAGEEEEGDEFLELPEASHIILTQGFLDIAPQLRAHYDSRVGDPLRTRGERFCWDHWHVPGQYNLMRTPADRFFPPGMYDRLEDALIEYGERELGCRGISPVWLSFYVHGCRQEWHTDAPHGPFAFVLSLTNWEGRRFSGGETMILQPHVLDYWRGFDNGAGMETPQLVTLVPAHFNQLTVFDPRLPHGVKQVEGTHDPLEGRIVLHGWFTQPSPFFSGSLSEEEATPALNASLDGLYAALQELPPAVGTVTLRLELAGDSGRVADIVWLANTLVARPQGGQQPWVATDATLATLAEHLFAACFPPSADGGPTTITLPFVFE